MPRTYTIMKSDGTKAGLFTTRYAATRALAEMRNIRRHHPTIAGGDPRHASALAQLNSVAESYSGAIVVRGPNVTEQQAMQISAQMTSARINA